MLKLAAVLLLLLPAVFPRDRVHRCYGLELNTYPGGVQLIVWEDRYPYRWPADWTTSICGKWENDRWYDANGTIIVPEHYAETQTNYDPEVRARNYWRDHGEQSKQDCIWKDN